MPNQLTINLRGLAIVAASMLTLLLATAFSSTASASNRVEASVDYETVECGETTFTAIAEGSSVANMYLVVYADGTTQSENIPTDGSTAEITVGPFTANTNIQWRVFGGGERDFDQPLWNGYGGPTFGSDIADYASQVGGYSWVIAGPNDPNPFTTWNAFDVEGCPLPADEKKVETSSAVSAASEVEADVQPVGAVDAGGGGGNSGSTASLIGLLASAMVFGLGAFRIRELALLG